MGKNFKKLEAEMMQKEKLCVLFYATWCPYSMEFLPVFEEYEKKHPGECRRVIFEDEPELCDKYSIVYFPSVILFKKGAISKRLDARPGVGLSRTQLIKLAQEP
jgi:thioredoxin 1